MFELKIFYKNTFDFGNTLTNNFESLNEVATFLRDEVLCEIYNNCIATNPPRHIGNKMDKWFNIEEEKLNEIDIDKTYNISCEWYNFIDCSFKIKKFTQFKLCEIHNLPSSYILNILKNNHLEVPKRVTKKTRYNLIELFCNGGMITVEDESLFKEKEFKRLYLANKKIYSKQDKIDRYMKKNYNIDNLIEEIRAEINKQTKITLFFQ